MATPATVFLPGKSHGQKSLVGCSPWDRKESDTTQATERACTTHNQVGENFVLFQSGLSMLLEDALVTFSRGGVFFKTPTCFKSLKRNLAGLQIARRGRRTVVRGLLGGRWPTASDSWSTGLSRDGCVNSQEAEIRKSYVPGCLNLSLELNG